MICLSTFALIIVSKADGFLLLQKICKRMALEPEWDTGPLTDDKPTGILFKASMCVTGLCDNTLIR